MKVIDACLYGLDYNCTTVGEVEQLIQDHCNELFTQETKLAELGEFYEDIRDYDYEERIADIVELEYEAPQSDERDYLYYEEPTMVIFAEEIGGENLINTGIAYRDELICAHCGQVLKLSDITITRELTWIDISEEVGGDELYE